MKNWGFQIHPGRQIDFDGNDRNLYHFLETKEPSIKLCFHCGSCSATCMSRDNDRVNLFKVNLMVKRGETKDLKAHLKNCLFCGKCQLVCPRGVNTRNVIHLLIKALRNESVF